MTLRPDLVNCWIFRDSGGSRQLLLLRRAPDEPILPGLWQCVSGGLEPGERIALGALRELREETGFDARVIEAFYDLDLVAAFHESTMDAVLTSAEFAVRVRSDAEPVLSEEHDAFRWVDVGDADAELIWPSYRTAVGRVREDLATPDRAAWFELTLDGLRRPR